MSHTSFKKNCTYLSHGTSCNDLKWCPARQVWKKLSKLSPWNFMAFMVRLKWDISVSFSSHITMNNISVSFLRLISHWRIFLCHPRLIRRWPASADWHIDKSLGTNTLPTPPTLYSPVSSQLFECTEAYTKFIFSLNFRRRKNENSQSQERRRALCQQC